MALVLASRRQWKVGTMLSMKNSPESLTEIFVKVGLDGAEP